MGQAPRGRRDHGKARARAHEYHPRARATVIAMTNLPTSSPLQRKPNKLDPALAEAIAHPPDGTEWGPAMKALPSDRHRAFVLALYQIRPGYGAQVKAAKMAGFGTSTSSAKSWSVIASQLAHDEKILEALREEDQKRIRASAPRAVRAL